MAIDDFIASIEDAIDELEPGALKAHMDYNELELFGSMHALILIALFNTEYDVMVTGDELRSCRTVLELFELVESKR